MSDAASRILSFIIVIVTASTLVSSSVPVAGATKAPHALVVADYAVITASHDRAAHVVNAADVANALATTRVNPASLGLMGNLGQIPGNPRLIALFSGTTFRSTCVFFPKKIDGAPAIVKCPANAEAVLLVGSDLLDFSRNVIATEATRGRAVSGADVIAAARGPHYAFVQAPRFRAGRGGKVRFSEEVNSGKAGTAVDLCVLFPKTEYGIPALVNC